MMWLTIIIFILILGLLVFVHELGHFIAARRAGCKVSEFGFGFPPRLWGIKKGETLYSINAIPIGGFVRILGEDGKNQDDPRSFAAKSKWSRFKILVAGVTMNILLAIVILFIGFMIGLPGTVDPDSTSRAQVVKEAQVRVAMVNPDSPAEEAGLKMGDALIAVEGQEVTGTEQATDIIQARKGEETTITIKRGDEQMEITANLRADPSEDEGALGVILGESGIVAYPWYEAAWRAVLTCGITIVQMFWVIGELFKNLFGFGDQTVAQSIAGPVGIAVLTDTFRKLGISYLMWFTAFLSINLAIINILPFPALDGGRLVFLGIEAVRKKKVGEKVENIFHTVGFTLLILLMVLITFRDVPRFSDPLKNLWEKIF